MGPILVPLTAIALLVAAVALALLSSKRRDALEAARIRTKSGRLVAKPEPPNRKVGRGPNRRLDL